MNDTLTPHVHVSATIYSHGKQSGAPVRGQQEPKHANVFVTSLSDLLNDSPDDWADRIIITVSTDEQD